MNFPFRLTSRVLPLPRLRLAMAGANKAKSPSVRPPGLKPTNREVLT